MAQSKFTLYKYIKLAGGYWRYCRAPFYSNGKIKPNRQLIDAFTALHLLYDHALKLPGISLSSLHCCFLSRRVPIASVPIQGGIPFLTPCLAACFSHLSVFSFQFLVFGF